VVGVRIAAGSDRLLTGCGVHLFIAGWLTVLLVLRLVLFPGSSEDDAEQLVFAQAWAWGYKNNQPPLYTWLVLTAQSLLGVGVAAVVTVKFVLLFALYAFVYRAARSILGEGPEAPAAALSVLGIYYIAWDSVLNYSNTVLVGAAVAATLWAVTRLERTAGFADYGLLGLCIGIGLLAKYNLGLFLLPLSVAALADPVLRHRIITPQALGALALGVVMAAPHLWWAFTDPAGLATAAASAPPAEAGETPLHGMWSAVKSAVSFLLPLLVLVVLFFPRAARPMPASEDSADRRRRRLLERAALGFAVLVAGAVTVAGLTEVRTHWMMVLLPFPIYAMLRVRGAGATRRVPWFAATMAALAAVVVIAVIVRWAVLPSTCRKCHFFIPYAELASQIQAAGFDGGTIVSYGHPNQLAGNLRRFFPDARLISARFPMFDPRPGEASGPCLIVWNASRDYAEGATRGFAAQRLGLDPSVQQMPARTAEAPLWLGGGRTMTLGFVIVSGGDGACRVP